MISVSFWLGIRLVYPYRFDNTSPTLEIGISDFTGVIVPLVALMNEANIQRVSVITDLGNRIVIEVPCYHLR